jgi:hypothetical protein
MSDPKREEVQCKSCGQIKSSKHFYMKRGRPDLAACMACKRIARRELYWSKKKSLILESSSKQGQSITQVTSNVKLSGPSVPPLNQDQLDVLVSIFSTLKRWKLEQIGREHLEKKGNSPQ